jgi:glucokinase
MLLAGDIGGTKTDLAIYSQEGGARAPLVRTEYPSAGYPSLEAMVQEFLSHVHEHVTVACFDVAGPVLNGRAKLTNLPWTLDATTLAHDLRLDTVHLLNDLQAIAYAVPILEPEDLHTLNPGTQEPHGAVAVIAPGTGLGEAFLTWEGDRYHAFPSEGGHADFAPSNALQVGLLQYLWQRYTHVSAELVCSGLGIPHIYAYLRDSKYAPETPAVAQRLAAASDPTPVIMKAALDETAPCALCSATLSTFIEILGAEAGNLALKVLATGGVYLAGGMPKRILPALGKSRILEAFRGKGRFADLLSRVPVHVVIQQAALMGAASHGLTFL